MESSVLSLPVADRVAGRTEVDAVHWQLFAVVFAATSVIVGLLWDISWHMTIGRDTFWTPAHLAIYTGGAVAGLASGFEVLRRSFFSGDTATKHDDVTVWRVFHGPMGGWLCIWGAVAMLTSAPFDDWWHNAYGLDVKILSPPHTILALGFISILAGARVMALTRQQRDVSWSGAGWLVAYCSGLVLVMAAIVSYEYQDPITMHRGLFYMVASGVFPVFLVSAALSTRLRWPATATAAVYTLVMAVQVWVLPLFAATPKLGPIRQPITHMVPLDFPLLLIVPALAIDLVLQRSSERPPWQRALLVGLTFVLVFAAVQWPFANLLVSASGHNWFFRSDNYPYMLPMDSFDARGVFLAEHGRALLRSFGWAAALAVVSARLGLTWGRWLRSVQR